MDERNESIMEFKEAVGVMTEGNSPQTGGYVESAVAKKKKGKKKKFPVWAIVLIILLVLGVVFAVVVKNAMGKMQTAMKDAMEQTGDEDLYTVEKIDIEQEISTSGTTIGIEENAYTSPVNAKVNDINVEVGQTIHKGDVLLTFDTEDLGDNLAKVKIQARSERAASNESFEAANKAAGKANKADSKAKKINKQVKSLKDDVEELNDEVVSKQDELTDAQEKNAKIEAANEAAKVEAKEKYNAKVAEAIEKGESTENITTEEVKQEALIDTKKIQNELRELNKELNKKTEKLTEKQTDLAEQKSISSANKEVSVSDSTKAQVSAANELSEMNVNDAQEAYDDGVAGIVAEEDGVVTAIGATKGAYVSETQTLFTYIDADQIGVQFTISKDNLGSIVPGQKARVVIGSKQYEGVVDYVSRVAAQEAGLTGQSATGGSIQGKITINNPDENLFIGVSAKVYVFVGKSEQTFGVPYESLNTDIKGDYVYVVDKNNKIQRKDVTIGIYSDEYYEITDGIEEGDKVIRNVTKDMKPGDEYVPGSAAMPGMPGMMQ